MELRPSKAMLRRLREIIQQRPADVQIGKKGIYDGVLKEIDRRLKEKGVVKVRIHKSALRVENMDRKSFAKKIAELVNAVLLDVRGRTFVLYRHKDFVKAIEEGRVGDNLLTRLTEGGGGRRGYGHGSRSARRPSH